MSEHQGCCSVNKRQQLVPAKETGVSWASPFSPLPSVYVTPAGKVWGKKPSSSPPQLKCVRAENWRRSVWSCACQHHGDHGNVTVRSCVYVSSGRRTCCFPEVLLSMVSPMPSFRKGFQTHTPKKEKGSFERWDLRRGSDSWAQREMARE